MVRINPKQVQEEIDEQEEFYGDKQEISAPGEDPKEGKDVEDDLEEFIGEGDLEKPDGKVSELDIAGQVEDDEEERWEE